MAAMRESWGQPSISFYSVSSDGENMYATALYDPYGELGCSNEPHTHTPILTDEDVEDMAIFVETQNEELMPWEQVKEDLARDGLL
jgi:hypothetical protein